MVQRQAGIDRVLGMARSLMVIVLLSLVLAMGGMPMLSGLGADSGLGEGQPPAIAAEAIAPSTLPNLTPAAAAIANAASSNPSPSNDSASDNPRLQSSPPFFPYPPSTWEKFEQVRRDPQLERLVQQDIENSIVIRQVIQDEVDRTFSHTTTLLNVLLVVLTAVPAVIAVGFWFLRRSVINQILTETRQQLKEEVEQQFTAAVAEELNSQSEAYQAEMDSLRQEFVAQLSQLKTAVSDAQRKKREIIEELSKILPSLLRDASQMGESPELHLKVQTLTQQLEMLQRQHSELAFSADDYVAQAKALFFEQAYEAAISTLQQAIRLDPHNSRAWYVQGVTLGRLKQPEKAVEAFEQALVLAPDFAEAWFAKGSTLVKLNQWPEAQAAYDRAISAKQLFYQAWFGKARLYALQNQTEQALVALRKAVAIEPERCREAARTDSALERLRQEAEFQTLVDDSQKMPN